MKIRGILVGVASVALLALTAYAAEIDLKEIKCVMNPKAAAKADKSVDYKGGKVFFCCSNCPKGFAKKIDAKDKVVAAKGNAQLVATGQAKQFKCVFTGGPAKAGTEVTVAGVAIKFCCNNCQDKAKKLKGDDQLVALIGDGAYKKGGFKIAKAKKE